MRSMPLVLGLLLAGVVVWLLLAGRRSPGGEYFRVGEQPQVQADGTPREAALVGTSAPTTPAAVTPLETHVSDVPIDPRTVARGSLTVRLVDAHDQAVDPSRVRVDLRAKGRAYLNQPLALRDLEAGTWTFRDVRVGPAIVQVRGDVLMDVDAPVVISESEQAPLVIATRPGGSILFRLKAFDETDIKEATVHLLDAAGRQVKARWQERHVRGLTTPQLATSLRLGIQGVVSRLKPGRYTLVGESAAGYEGKTDVEVVAGQQAEVTLAIRE